MQDPRLTKKASQAEIATPIKALLVSVYKGTPKEVANEHLEELALLSYTFGLDVVGKVICPIRRYDAATFVTEGKLQELILKSQELEAELIVFDDEISPSQQRNLENAFKTSVVDRTELILGVFGQRAQTKEARLQIELAEIKYQAPRLRRLWTHLSRQAASAGGGGSGGGGYLKGEGEKQIEIDRRILKQDVNQLQKELKEVRNTRETQRNARLRSDLPIFSIIGYTNAGKSTLLNALTEADVLVEDKLFATLDTTTRKFTLPNNQEILLIDTVGFIRKLPHLLIHAFKSTLEEAFQADILLHLIDLSHHMAEEQAETTFEVLKELNVKNKPIITVLNKIDKCDNEALIQKFRIKYPHVIAISALNKTGFTNLLDEMIHELSKQRQILFLKIPQSEYHVVSEVMRLGNILNQTYEENDILLEVDMPESAANKLSKYKL